MCIEMYTDQLKFTLLLLRKNEITEHSTEQCFKMNILLITFGQIIHYTLKFINTAYSKQPFKAAVFSGFDARQWETPLTARRCKQQLHQANQRPVKALGPYCRSSLPNVNTFQCIAFIQVIQCMAPCWKLCALNAHECHYISKTI